MNKEEIYKFNNLWVSYDKGTDNDRSCLTIGKVDKTNIYVLGELYDERADIFRAMINDLQQENNKLNENWNKLKEKIKNEQLGQILYSDRQRFANIDELLAKMQELEKSDSNE